MWSSENEILLSLTPPVPPEVKYNSSFADRPIKAEEEESLYLWLMAQVGIAAFSHAVSFWLHLCSY